MLLIDPAFETLLEDKPEEEEGGEAKSESNPDHPPPLTWHKYWYERLVPHAQGLWLSAVLGFNRLSLMVGLMKVVEDPRLAVLLPKEVQTRKVGK